MTKADAALMSMTAQSEPPPPPAPPSPPNDDPDYLEGPPRSKPFRYDPELDERAEAHWRRDMARTRRRFRRTVLWHLRELYKRLPPVAEPSTPKLALRPEEEHGPHNRAGVPLDDVVVTNVVIFRAEFMDDNSLWMRCYLDNGEEMDFHVSTKRAPITLIATDLPRSFEDFDAG